MHNQNWLLSQVTPQSEVVEEQLREKHEDKVDLVADFQPFDIPALPVETSAVTITTEELSPETQETIIEETVTITKTVSKVTTEEAPRPLDTSETGMEEHTVQETTPHDVVPQEQFTASVGETVEQTTSTVSTTEALASVTQRRESHDERTTHQLVVVQPVQEVPSLLEDIVEQPSVSLTEIKTDEAISVEKEKFIPITTDVSEVVTVTIEEKPEVPVKEIVTVTETITEVVTNEAALPLLTDRPEESTEDQVLHETVPEDVKGPEEFTANFEEFEGPHEFIPSRITTETQVAETDRQEVHDTRAADQLVVEQPVEERPFITEEVRDQSVATISEVTANESTSVDVEKPMPKVEETITEITADLSPELQEETRVLSEEVANVVEYKTDLEVTEAVPADETVVTVAELAIIKEEKPMEVTVTVPEEKPTEIATTFVTEEVTELTVEEQSTVHEDVTTAEVVPQSEEIEEILVERIHEEVDVDALFQPIQEETQKPTEQTEITIIAETPKRETVEEVTTTETVVRREVEEAFKILETTAESIVEEVQSKLPGESLEEHDLEETLPEDVKPHEESAATLGEIEQQLQSTKTSTDTQVAVTQQKESHDEVTAEQITADQTVHEHPSVTEETVDRPLVTVSQVRAEEAVPVSKEEATVAPVVTVETEDFKEKPQLPAEEIVTITESVTEVTTDEAAASLVTDRSEESLEEHVLHETIAEDVKPLEEVRNTIEEFEGPVEIIPTKTTTETLVAVTDRKEVHDERTPDQINVEQPTQEQLVLSEEIRDQPVVTVSETITDEMSTISETKPVTVEMVTETVVTEEIPSVREEIREVTEKEAEVVEYKADLEVKESAEAEETAASRVELDIVKEQKPMEVTVTVPEEKPADTVISFVTEESTELGVETQTIVQEESVVVEVAPEIQPLESVSEEIVHKEVDLDVSFEEVKVCGLEVYLEGL